MNIYWIKNMDQEYLCEGKMNYWSKENDQETRNRRVRNFWIFAQFDRITMLLFAKIKTELEVVCAKK